MKPSELKEGHYIRIEFVQHPDCYNHGKPDPEIGHPSGAIVFDVDYSQLTMKAIDKGAETGSDGILIMSDSTPEMRSMMDQVFKYFQSTPNAVITTGSYGSYSS